MHEHQAISAVILFSVDMGIAGNWAAGKLLGNTLSWTMAAFLTGTLLVPLGFQYSRFNSVPTILIIALWGLLYFSCYLLASAR